MKILTVIGARPQFIKASALSRALIKVKNVEEIILHTGQHFDDNMSKIFFDELEIPQPKYNLKINNLIHGAMTGRMLEQIEAIAIIEKPDVLLVYGDTNSTLAGALAGKKLGIKIAHVESGLRSFNMEMPEEINRILTDRISDYLFYPTKRAGENLISEGFQSFDCQMINSGDVMLDSVNHFAQLAEKKSNIIEELNIKDYVLATVHRAENTNEERRLKDIIEALNTINEEIEVVLPLHPRTKDKIEKAKIKVSFRIIDPVGYLNMIQLITNSKLILTDSGGLQKEAYFFKKPCITLRDETEWRELVDCGVNEVTGSSKPSILKAFNKMKNDELDFTKSLYGEGNASEIISHSLLNGTL